MACLKCGFGDAHLHAIPCNCMQRQPKAPEIQGSYAAITRPHATHYAGQFANGNSIYQVPIVRLCWRGGPARATLCGCTGPLDSAKYANSVKLDTYTIFMSRVPISVPSLMASPHRERAYGAVARHADECHTEAPCETQPLLRPPEEAEWKPPRGFVWIQLALMNNVFLNAFDGTITASTYAVISSEFGAANTASWLTTSYLITSTAVQPLYGRISDIFGRRICFLVSTVAFSVGCLGCGTATNIVTLNLMRAVAGFGGGGLHIMGMTGK